MSKQNKQPIIPPMDATGAKEILAATHTAANFLHIAVKRHVHPIVCGRTGIIVAAVTVEKVAGHSPYLSHWKDTQALHPLFSLEPVALLNFSRSVWHHFCSLSPEEAADPVLTEKQELLLRIAALAMLHQLSDVEQTTTWMPSLGEISNHWSSLLALSYWKNYLESKRFRFPNLRISKFNKGIDLGGYLHDCWQVKKDYESKVREAVEVEKLKSAEMALRVLRDDLAGKAPRSKKLLWRWFLANIPSRYAKDTETWMWDLFDAETDSELSEFTLADIDLFEQIVLAEVELGSVISHTFLERLAVKRKRLEAKLQTYEIIIPQAITAAVADGSITADEPLLRNYPNKIKWMIAHAKWKLAFTDMKKYSADGAAKQTKVTVNPTFIPDISEYLGRDDSKDGSDEIDDVPLADRIAKNKEFDNPTGELED